MVGLDSYLEEQKSRFEDDLCAWLRMPSVSTDSAFADDVRQAASWLHQRFDDIGLASEIIETCGHPIVYAESPAVPGAPSVLVYGHYDVQPPDPLDEWETPPFEPDIRNRNVFARGATDDKGQMITHLFSTEAWMKTAGKLPVQLKFLIEGEEECGSAGMYEFLAGKYDNGKSVKEKIAADIAVISDTSQYGPDMPAITYGLKGICYFQLNLSGPDQDLHSGAFGGTLTNPANALSAMLSSLINDKGQIQIPGFYDDILPLTEREKEQFADLNFSDQQYMDSLGIDAVAGEDGFTTLERRWARPTFDINGLSSGYQGEGAKTVLPAKASAKFSFRLVPNQDPKKIAAALKQHLESVCPAGIKWNWSTCTAPKDLYCRWIALSCKPHPKLLTMDSENLPYLFDPAEASPSSTRLARCSVSTHCFLDGDKTMTTHTAQTRSFLWTISKKEFGPALDSGKN